MTKDINQLAVWNFLNANQLGTLATVNSKGAPDLSAIYFFVDENFSCFFVTKTETRKYINTQTNHNASLLIYNEVDLLSIEIKGVVEIVTEAGQVASAIQKFQALALTRKVGYWIPPISQLDAGQYAVCRLTPEVVNVNNYTKDLNNPELPSQLSFNPNTH
jgi:pyridoxine/pyridoxamine 5'-phosphate oxidase